jgi:error-prone DNA polymerase
MTAYAELAVATNFSFLRGASHPEELVARAAELGLSAIGVADRNSLAGVVRAHVALRETGANGTGLRLLVGARLVFADGTPDILAYPEDRAAWGRLSRLLTLGKMRTRKGDCRLALDDLLEWREGLLLVVMPGRRVDQRLRETLERLKGGGPAKLQLLHPEVRSASARSLEGRTTPMNFAGIVSLHGRGASFEARPRRAPQDEGRASMATAKPPPIWLGATLTHGPHDRRRLDALAALAAETGVPLLAANDVLYHAPERRPLQDALTCIREHVTVETAGRRLAVNAERHLKAPAEMARLFRRHPEAVAETLRLAARARFSLDDLRYEYPDEPVPPGEDPQSWLEKLTWAGAAERYPPERFPGGVPEKVKGLLAKEFALIRQLGYALYFLTVHDIAREARARGILAQGRGSAANSAVCFCLGVTAVDPAEADLLFERFLSAERKEPPDIDIDFEHERREEIIQYIYERYGRDRAGLCATVVSYRPRSAIREVGKAMGLTEDVTAKLADTSWGSWGRGFSDEQVRQAGFDPGNPMIARTVALARELMGFPRHLSQHVGGFILTRGRLDETVPIGWAAMEDRSFIEWDKDDIDALGILKVDVLALGMLTCIRKALDLIRERKGQDLALDTIPKEDPDTYAMIQRADTLGVFQIESRAQMNMLPRLKPATFYDLVIEVAIVRPGPIQGDMVHPYLRRRQGIDPVHFPSPHPDHGPPDELERVLGKTLGVPLFQEQAMRIAIEAAKFTPEEANRLRRAMATFRRVGTIHLFQQKMVEGMVRRGYDAEFAARCFRQIEGFGEYGFPESHAASFAKLVYVSCWLKRHHPDIFACALLNSQPMGFYAPAQIVRDAREHGVEAREADVNLSGWDNGLEGGGIDVVRPSRRRFAAPQDEEREGAAILDLAHPEEPRSGVSKDAQGSCGAAALLPLRLGFRQIDGLGEADARKLLAARAARPFASMEDFARRTRLPRRAVRILAEADAFRSLGLDRRRALWEASRLPDDAPLPLFAAADARELPAEPAPRLPDLRLSEHVVTDYQTTGLSLKGHPMGFLRPLMESRRIVACRALAAISHGGFARAAGIILVRQKPGSAKGVVFMTIEDETGIANIVVWESMAKRFRKEVMGARLIEVWGRVQKSPEGIVHLVATTLVDRSTDLLRLSADEMPAPLAHADEVARPVPEHRHIRPRHSFTRPESAPQVQPTLPPPRTAHPREVRAIPRSRDFR